MIKKAINLISKLILENNDSNLDLQQFCKYYSIEELNMKKIQNKNPFSILHLNIHSLQLHKNDLDVLLDSLNI